MTTFGSRFVQWGGVVVSGTFLETLPNQLPKQKKHIAIDPV